MNREEFRGRVLAEAARGTTIVTANKRLGRHLAALYGAACRQQGQCAWLAPNILSLPAWIERMLAQLGEDHRILRPAVAQRLWEDVIRADAEEHGLELLQVAASARMAMKADQLLTDYGGEFPVGPQGEDQRAFARWRERFQATCASGNWIAPAAGLELLEGFFKKGRAEAPTGFLLAGFDELTPSLKRLAAVLADQGSRVIEMSAPTAPVGALTRVSCRDASDEVRTAARWARALADGTTRRIGIVVPEFDVYRSLIERIFLEEMDPGALLAISDEGSRFNLSLGAPLALQGPVALALALLSCGREPSLEEVSRLLRTPYLGGGQGEGEARGLFDRFLRSLRRDSFTLGQLLNLLGPGRGRFSGHSGLPILKKIFRVLEKTHPGSSLALPGAWAGVFDRLLDQVGWPGDRPLDSREFQVVRAWREDLLGEFAGFDLTSAPIPRQEAVGLLRKLANEIDFQPELPDPGVQVCGVLEAGGLEFDHLWVLGLHEDAWPPPARPNPFLPLPLQVAARMPHADAGREVVYTGRLMERLMAAAPQVCFSHPSQEGDCSLRPSPLIAGLPEGTVPLAPSQAPQQNISSGGMALEKIRDEAGTAWSPAEPVPGGTAILRDQALCPFRAFAHHRLGVQGFARVAPGIDPATRGTLVHAALGEFWTRTAGHAALCALGPDERRERVRESVTTALSSHFSRFPPIPPAAIQAIEENRLAELLEDWLTAVELARPPFDRVATEIEWMEVFGGLRIRTKIDRIDTLAGGERIIIDYKTGRIVLDDLVSEQMLEPQLPIYAIGAGGQDLVGVAIGQIRRGDCTLRAITRDDGLLPGTPAFAESRLAVRHGLAGWGELLDRWQNRLEQLGRDFVSGRADVNPVSREKACRTCDLASLCRIAEAEALPADDEVSP